MAGKTQKQKNNNRKLQAQVASQLKKTKRETRGLATAEALKKLNR